MPSKRSPLLSFSVPDPVTVTFVPLSQVALWANSITPFETTRSPQEVNARFVSVSVPAPHRWNPTPPSTLPRMT